MNVYVRQLAAALARTGVEVDVYTRADDPSLPAVIPVEPGLNVHHIAAGPLGPMPKRALAGVVDEFTEGVAARLPESPSRRPARELLAVGRRRPRAEAPLRAAVGLHVPHPVARQGPRRR